MGLPPGAVSSSLKTANALGIRFATRAAGEEFRTDVFAPRGYRLCDARVQVISAAPVGQRRSPTFAATVQTDTHFELNSFVHKQGIGGARSWVEAVATLRFARRGSAQERSCHFEPGLRYQYRCRQHDGAQCGLNSYGKMPRAR